MNETVEMWIRRIVGFVDGVSDWIGAWILAFLALPLLYVVCHEVDRALCVQCADQLGVRTHLHDLRRLLHAGRRLHPAQGRPCPHRHLLQQLVVPHPRHHRHDALHRRPSSPA